MVIRIQALFKTVYSCDLVPKQKWKQFRVQFFKLYCIANGDPKRPIPFVYAKRGVCSEYVAYVQALALGLGNPSPVSHETS